MVKECTMVMFTVEKHQKKNDRWFITKISEKRPNPHLHPPKPVTLATGTGSCE
jgi:hypothetical protein